MRCDPRTSDAKALRLFRRIVNRPWGSMARGWVVFAIWLGVSIMGRASDPADVEFFEKRIRPVLVEHCYRCHAADAKKIRGGLLLDSAAAVQQGGESGPAVVPGKPDESLLLEAIRYESFEMPPAGRLPEDVIADFEQWIRGGAIDPRDGPSATTVPTTIDIEAGKEFWSFRPRAAGDPPAVSAAEWPASNIDRYLLARMEAEGLRPVGDADRATLIRRAHLALIGLPPTPDEVDAFVDDPAPTSMAFAGVVDRLLDSQQFGERWGRHWLDVVRFAESSGGGRTLLFPDAWRYRDYVIEALNRDVRYDQFVKQQIAGDLLAARDWRQRREQLVATALLVLGPTNYELQDKEVLEMDIVDEQLDTLGKALLGMTIGCARCHDHKFDPIPTRDYYALAGILKSTKSVIHANVSAWNTVDLPLPAEQEAEIQGYEQRLARLKGELQEKKKALQALDGASTEAKSIDPALLAGIVVDDSQARKKGRWVSSQAVAGFVGNGYSHDNNARDETMTVSYFPDLPEAGEYEVRTTHTPGKNRSKRVPVRVFHGNGEATVFVDQSKPGSIARTMESLGKFIFDPSDQPHVVISNEGAADGVVIADAVIFIRTDQLKDPEKADAQYAAAQRGELAGRIQELEQQLEEVKVKVAERPRAMAVEDEATVADVHLAIRGVVHNQGDVVPRGVLRVACVGELPEIPPNQSGRVELADWIASADNPLTSRVIVNRVWYWLFGQGLVRTVDNFGATGERPSHPELLDYLAQSFIDDGWSIKQLIRRIMLSHAYRLDSLPSPEAVAVDPDNRLLSHVNRRRLDAETIRDTFLFVAGRLDRAVGGPNIKPGTTIEYGYAFDSTRRSVYLPVFRNALPEIFATFDFADPNIQSGRRTTSTIAPQALLLMNHPFVIEQSRAAAERLMSETTWTSEQRVMWAFRAVLGRPASPREAELAAEFIGNDASRWSLLFQALFQSLDFRYVN